MNDPTYKGEPSYDLLDALKLPLLFYTVGRWTPESRAEWLRITGTPEASTKTMCDHLRSAVALIEDRRQHVKDPDEKATEVLRALRGCATDEQYREAHAKVKELLHYHFDLGFKAAGGTIS